ncbi:hypothetical protein [Halopiger goleimassiliensis]|uniref:hypothetical protein n=1 Tax=Halopiger goleimassiliensis TaxID=1293048 RepID=UPI00067805DE|nr:hypothetical protein [Halopiger goleimassiliensis]
MARTLPIEDVRPTQLYLSSEKLAAVLDWFDCDDPNYGTVPAFEHDGEWYLSDGHTRAFAAFLAGSETLALERDAAVRTEYDFDVYRQCIEWCQSEGVETVADFAGRVVGPEAYERLWVERCQQAGSGAGG